MKYKGRVVVLCLAAALCASPTGQGQDKEKKDIRKEVVNLARESEEGKDVAARMTGLGKQFGSIAAAMRMFNPTDKGGIGIGSKGRGIEARLIELEEKAMDAAVVKAEASDLARIAHVSLVMSEAFRRFAPKKAFLGRGEKEWQRDLNVMKEGSLDLAKAVKAGDAKAIKAAATRINNACNSCHDGVK